MQCSIALPKRHRGQRFARSLLALLSLVILLGLTWEQVYADSPPNLTADIPWTDTGGVFKLATNTEPGIDDATFDGVVDTMAAFNHARRQEEIQLGLTANTLGTLDLPSQLIWDTLSDDDKALRILNEERTDRANMQPNILGLPLAGIEPNIDRIAQAYAQVLVNGNTFIHNAGGKFATGRIQDDLVLDNCHEFLTRSENLAAFWGTTQTQLYIERSFYNWIYADASSQWGHREAALLQDIPLRSTDLAGGYKNNVGDPNSEGYMGIGVLHDPNYTFSNNIANPGIGTIVVMNIFDPLPSCQWPSALTDTPTPVDTATPTSSPTPSPTVTPTPTITPTPILVATSTATPTLTNTPTLVDTPTPTTSLIPSPTPSPTAIGIIDIILFNNTIVENSPLPASVGFLTAVNPNRPTVDNYTYTILGNEQTSFTVNTTGLLPVLEATVSLDANTNPTYNVTILAEDENGLSYQKTFTIYVLGVVESPTPPPTPRSVPTASPELAIPNEIGELLAIQGQSLAVPISFDADGGAFMATDVSLTYDTSCLEFIDSTAYPGLTAITPPTEPGQLAIHIHNLAGALPDQTDLVTLNFSVLNNPACINQEVMISATNLPAFIYTSDVQETTGLTTAIGTFEAGRVHVLQDVVRGDCSGDGRIDANDLSAVIIESFDGGSRVAADGPLGGPEYWLYAYKDVFVGNPLGCDVAPTSDLRLSASNPSRVEIADLLCLVNVLFDDDSCTDPTVAASARRQVTASSSNDRIIEIEPARQADIPIVLRNGQNKVMALNFTAQFNVQHFDLVEIRMENRLFTAQSVVDHQEGRIEVIIYSFSETLPTLADGTVVWLVLQAQKGRSLVVGDGDVKMVEFSVGSADENFDSSEVELSIALSDEGDDQSHTIYMPMIAR